MTAQFQFFQSLPHKKADFVKKSRQNMGYKKLTFSGGQSPDHPPILYEFNFGSLTNTTLREIERELTEVNGSLQPIVTFMKT